MPSFRTIHFDASKVKRLGGELIPLKDGTGGFELRIPEAESETTRMYHIADIRRVRK